MMDELGLAGLFAETIAKEMLNDEKCPQQVKECVKANLSTKKLFDMLRGLVETLPERPTEASDEEIDRVKNINEYIELLIAGVESFITELDGEGEKQ